MLKRVIEYRAVALFTSRRYKSNRTLGCHHDRDARREQSMYTPFVVPVAAQDERRRRTTITQTRHEP
jgi:hypothetical protein